MNGSFVQIGARLINFEAGVLAIDLHHQRATGQGSGSGVRLWLNTSMPQIGYPGILPENPNVLPAFIDLYGAEAQTLRRRVAQLAENTSSVMVIRRANEGAATRENGDAYTTTNATAEEPRPKKTRKRRTKARAKAKAVGE